MGSRADADTAIQTCDQQLSEQAAAAAQAQAQAQAQAKAAAQARAQAIASTRADAVANALFGTNCRSHGGVLSSTEPDNTGYDPGTSDPAGDYCVVTYSGSTYAKFR